MEAVQYLNRLSDAFFVWSRWANHQLGIPEVLWEPNQSASGRLNAWHPACHVLCIASYEKGHEFLRECKRQGCRVFLLTSLSLKDTADWPLESLDDIFYMPDQDKTWNRNDTILAISHLARTATDRPHRPAGRLRPGDGGVAFASTCASRDGRDHHALFPRQAGDADEGDRSRLAGAGFRPPAERREG